MGFIFLSLAWIMLWFCNELYIKKHPGYLNLSLMSDLITAIMYQPLLYITTILLLLISILLLIYSIYRSISMMFHPSDWIKYAGVAQFTYGFYIGVQAYLYFPHKIRYILPVVLAIFIAIIFIRPKKGKFDKNRFHQKREWA